MASLLPQKLSSSHSSSQYQTYLHLQPSYPLPIFHWGDKFLQRVICICCLHLDTTPTNTGSRVPTLSQWLLLRSPSNTVSLNPVNMFQSLSYFSGILDLLHTPSSWYVRFASLASQDRTLPCSPFVDLAGSILSSHLELVYPPLPNHQIIGVSQTSVLLSLLLTVHPSK